MAKPVSMPNPPVASGSDDPRFSPDSPRSESMVEIDFGPDTLLAVKQVDPNSIGTRGDETGIAAEIIRKDH